ncbi:hypothetical protein QAD02_010014 [Eretmocerus hayati]|uniref:Uncharacterized protein n=1 Tax=Eretmocerus hayati TaxID=131215 RepID=A0ACC2NCB6_9HYME|nr:hypothetical protein QAD02_010014 [Eretmocerus hayati]
MGPVKYRLNDAKETLERTPAKEWLCGGFRTVAVAAELIRNSKVVAVPTDTIYGLAGLAQDKAAIARLYEIKERDPNKPLAICVCDNSDIEKWAHTEDLPDGLLDALLPGPTTLVLKRKEALNQTLNPGNPNIGVRVPAFEFVRSLAKMVNGPIALTSANKSGKRSTLHPKEFEDLWSELDGVFYDKVSRSNLKNSWRSGSTVVDLTVKGEFTILRRGIGFRKTFPILQKFQLTERPRPKRVKPVVKEDTHETSEIRASASNS